MPKKEAQSKSDNMDKNDKGMNKGQSTYRDMSKKQMREKEENDPYNVKNPGSEK